MAREEWIDPYEMSVKKASVPQNVATLQNDCNCNAIIESKCESTVNFAFAHYKRMINMLLSAVVIDRTDTFNYKGQLFINIPFEEYDKLKSFVINREEDPATLRSIDVLLSKILTKPRFQHFTDELVSWMDRIYFAFYNRTAAILASCIFVLLISYKLLRAKLTIWSVTKYLIFLGWVTDFAFTWINLLQEAEINKMADSLKYSLPPECDPNQMGVWQYIKYSIGWSDSCREYYQTIFKDHFWSIGPVLVLSHQLGVLVLTPAAYVGQALGSFVNGILATLPFGLNLILLPILLIFAAILTCILFAFITETSFGINILHIFQLQFGKEERRAVGDVLSGRNLNALINVLHCNAIKEVRQADTVDNTNTVLDSNFRGAVKQDSVTAKINSETKKDCDITGDSNRVVVKAEVPEMHDGSGDTIECLH